MKKILTIVTGVVLAATIVLASGLAKTNAYAASASQKNLKDATFLGALHGQNQDDTELILALYEKSGEKIAYVNDGVSEVYTSFTKKDSTMPGIGSVEKYTIGNTLVLNFFVNNGIPCLITEDGTIIYVCEYLTADTITALMS